MTAQISFYGPPSIAPYSATAVTAGDFNGDGKLDLIMSNTQGTGTNNIFWNNGDGTFTAGPMVQGYPEGYFVADFNGDGKLDLLSRSCPSGSSSGSWCVQLGNGDGTFQPPITSQGTIGFSPLLVADINGDGKLDVLATGQQGFGVFLGNGDGTFTAGPSGPHIPYMPSGPIVMDFNGDGKLDLAFAGAGTISVLLGNGDGSFQAPVNSTGVASPMAMAAGDLNGDGRLDLAVADSSTFQTFTLLGNGDGTFQLPAHSVPCLNNINSGYMGYTTVNFAALTDVNGDGKLDLITTSSAYASGGGLQIVQILLGNGDGSFTPVGHAYLSGATVVADFNGDGKPDLVSGDSILLGNGDGTFQGVPVFLPASYSTAAVAADLNNDRKPDMAVIAQDPSTKSFSLNILLGDGKGGFSLARTYPFSQDLSGATIASADLNGDGKLDLVIGSGGTTSSIIALVGNGDGSFGSPVVNPVGSSQNAPVITVADFNGDHKSDLAVSGVDENVYVMTSKGDGTFTTTVIIFGNATGDVVSGDFNGDGKADLAVATGAGLQILLGNGNGTFQPAVIIGQAGVFPTVLIPGDFNGDGKLDLFAQVVESTYLTYLGNGDGTFSTVVANFPNPSDLFGFTFSADLNGDGYADLLGWADPWPMSRRESPQTGAASLGHGDGTFDFPLWIPPPLVVADFNQDNRPDIASITGSGQGISIFLNTTAAESTALSVSPASVNFGPQSVGTTGSSTIVLTNTGSHPVNVSEIGTDNFPDFSSQNCIITIAPGGSCAITVTFTPSEIGQETGSVEITSNTAFSPQTVSLSGTGVSLGLTVAGSSSATIAAGSMASYDLSIGGKGWSGQLSFNCTGLPKGTACASASPVSVSATTATSVTLNVTTTARTMANATPNRSMPSPWLWAVVIVGMIALPSIHMKRSALRRFRVFPFALLLLFCSCGGQGSSNSTGPQQNPNGTPSGTYHLVVTANSGSMSESVQLTLVVQ